MVDFRGIFDIGQAEDLLDDDIQINKWNRIVIKFKDKLVKIVKDVNSRLDYYSISPTIRQMLLHWAYEFVEFLMIYFFVHIKMNYYWFNTKELLQKAKEIYYNGGGKKKLLKIILKTGGL